jgi:hypothetical protein
MPPTDLAILNHDFTSSQVDNVLRNLLTVYDSLNVFVKQHNATTTWLSSIDSLVVEKVIMWLPSVFTLFAETNKVLKC